MTGAPTRGASGRASGAHGPAPEQTTPRSGSPPAAVFGSSALAYDDFHLPALAARPPREGEDVTAAEVDLRRSPRRVQSVMVRRMLFDDSLSDGMVMHQLDEIYASPISPPQSPPPGAAPARCSDADLSPAESKEGGDAPRPPRSRLNAVPLRPLPPDPPPPRRSPRAAAPCPPPRVADNATIMGDYASKRFQGMLRAAEALLQRFDSDRDGRLSLPEFNALLRASHAARSPHAATLCTEETWKRLLDDVGAGSGAPGLGAEELVRIYSHPGTPLYGRLRDDWRLLLRPPRTPARGGSPHTPAASACSVARTAADLPTPLRPLPVQRSPEEINRIADRLHTGRRHRHVSAAHGWFDTSMVRIQPVQLTSGQEQELVSRLLQPPERAYTARVPYRTKYQESLERERAGRRKLDPDDLTLAFARLATPGAPRERSPRSVPRSHRTLDVEEVQAVVGRLSDVKGWEAARAEKLRAKHPWQTG
eukprot:TRINITY_DN21153_c0_g1_i1.p1 TRINITY_DN21153_c0_g1~~TRINITY_DN21153_c0_g1_i1.p1  ORF type:complete len:521 (+),score=80.34 TRINITY_DN21153_c0_g1_i1:129-1565(+)